MSNKPYSIRKRFAFIAAPIYILVVAVVTTALDQTFQKTALKGQRERLESIVYSALGSVVWRGEPREIDLNEATFSVPGVFDPEADLGLMILGKEGEVRWSSQEDSLLETDKLDSVSVGEWSFEEVRSALGPSFALQFAVDWLVRKNQTVRLQFVALQSQEEFRADLMGFRKTLWVAVLLASLALALAIFLLFQWGMKPATRFERELSEVRAGDKRLIERDYPEEMEPLKSSVNTLLAKERQQSERTGHLLDDLAHSLKTPLAVLRSRFARENREEEDLAQVERIEGALNYYVKKARSSQRLSFEKPLPVLPVLKRLKKAMEKSRSDEPVRIHVGVEEDFHLPLAEGDLFEVLGNLFDNAKKYGRGEVWVRSKTEGNRSILEIEDNGPGFDLARKDAYLKRGFRADEDTEGSGLGLHLVHEIAEDYGLTLSLSNSERGGGLVSLSLPRKNS